MTPIVPIPKSDTKYFGDKTIPEFWLEIPASSPSVSNNNDYMNRLKNCLESAPKDSVICVFSEELSSITLCKSIAEARDNGRRIYILTNNYNNEMKILDGCLIRYGGGKRIGSFILTNPNSNMPSGCMFTGRLADASVSLPDNLLLDLDNNQILALFRYFCYQFWNKAEKERNGQGKNNEEHNSASAPLDIYPPVNDSCDFEYLKSVWGKEAQNAQITASLLAEGPYMKFINFSHSNIVSLFSGINDNLVRSLKQKQNEIYVHDGSSLINTVKTGGNTWLIPKIDAAHEEEVYALLLNDEQIKILDKYIIMVSQGKVQYRYFESDTRENLSDKTIIKLGDSISKKYKIEPHSTIPVQLPPPSELLSWEDFKKQEPDFIDDGRSVSIKYEWTIVPFTLPLKSDKHQLYQDWTNAEKTINKYIDNIKESILENEKGENKFFKLIPRFLLTKQQKFDEYRSDLNILQEIKYGGISKQDLQDKIKKINEIKSAVEKDSGEIIEEGLKADLQRQIEEKKKEKEELDAKLVEIQELLRKTDEAVKIQSDNLKKLEEQREEKSKEIKEAKTKLDDLVVKQKKIIDDKKNMEREINECKKSIDDLNEQLKNPAKEPQKKGSALSNLMGGGKKPSQSGHAGELSVPDFPHLPSIGDLYKHNGQDYLAITNWEDYDQGKAEAKRLNAKLCAKGENNG